MKEVVKQVAGIDVAQKELVICPGRMTPELQVELYAHKSFPNSEKGFLALVGWAEKHTSPGVALRYVMEATGVSHGQLAYQDRPLRKNPRAQHHHR